MLRSLALLLVVAVSQAAERPNIVLIMADDMGYSDLGCYGGEAETPNLDSLAKNGLRFTQFYNTGRCCPTRAALMTGLYPHQAGMGHMTRPAKKNGKVLPGYTAGINGPCVTIPEVLGPAGYRCYMSGKWHVTTHKGKPDGASHNWPMQRGFDRFYGTLGGAGNFYDPPGLCRGNEWVTIYTDKAYQPWGDRRPESGEYYYTQAIADNAVEFLKDHNQEHGDKPFFLYLPFTAPHWPMHAWPEDVAKYQGRFDAGYDQLRKERFARMKELGVIAADAELSKTRGDWGRVEKASSEEQGRYFREWELRGMEVYAAMIDRMDQEIGKVLNELRAQDRYDNTLVLFCQDNGGCAEKFGRKPNPKWAKAAGEPLPDDHFFNQSGPPLRDRTTGKAHSGFPTMPGPPVSFVGYGEAWANVSNTPFRRYKHYVHEGGIATPLVAHWPKGIMARGELREQPSHLIDVMATCVDLAGADYPTESKGREILPMQGVSLRAAFRGEDLPRDTLYWEHEGNCAVRTGDWKLVRLKKGSWELYDLSKDRSELHDLSGEQPERAASMQADWERWAIEAKVFPSPFLPTPKINMKKVAQQ